MLLLPALLPFFCLSTVGLLLLRLFSPKSRGANPQRLPGPKGIPWLGPLHELPRRGAWFTFRKWADQYGSIFEVTLLGQRTLFVNTEEAARRLLVERGNIYSGRPSIHAVHDSQSKQGSGIYFPLMSKNKLWSDQKKAWIMFLNNARATGAAANAVEIETANYLLDLHQLAAQNSPTCAWAQATEMMTARASGRLTFGDASLAARIRHETHYFLKHISPGTFLPNLAWPLRYIPAAVSPWKIMEHHRHSRQQAFYQSAIAAVQRQLDNATAPPSFAKTYLESFASPAHSTPASLVPNPRHATGLLSMAASFNNLTIAQPLVSFVRCLGAYPMHFAPLYAELSKQVPSSRLPLPSDIPHLPYLRAVLAETCRFRPPIPTNIPHELEADDVVDGVFFPAGTPVFAPSYTLSRDPHLFPQPTKFHPARWLDPGSPVYREPLTRYPNLTAHSSLFGHGKRYCIGAELTEAEIILAAARLVWGFTWRLSDAGEREVQDVGPGEERAGMRFPRGPDAEAMVVSKTGSCEVWIEERKGVDVAGIVGAHLAGVPDLCMVA